MKRGRISTNEKELIQQDHKNGSTISQIAAKFERAESVIQEIVGTETPPKQTPPNNFAKKNGFVGMTESASQVADEHRSKSNNLDRPHIFVMDPNKPVR